MGKDSYIGVFDSGIGGMTVVQSIVETMPKENIIYFGDTAHVPYGTRSKAQITEYVLADVQFLRQFDLKAMVIACNTADSVAKEKVVEAYPDMPVFGVVEPASAQAAKTTRNGKIGVIATNATVKTKAYQKAIARYNPEAQVYMKACPLLVPLVENGQYRVGNPVVNLILADYLKPLAEEGIDTLVLGCTHYPLLADAIASLFPELTLISSSTAAAACLKETLQAEHLERDSADPGTRQFFVSDAAENFQEQAEILLGEALTDPVQQVTLLDKD